MEIATIGAKAPVLTAPTQIITTQQAEETREIVHAVKAVNEARLFGDNNELTFVLDRKTRKPLLRIVDRDTKEVVRQIPPEHVLRLAEKLVE